MLCLTCWLKVAVTAGEVSGKTRRETPLRMWALKLISDLSSLTFAWMEANSLNYEMLLFIFGHHGFQLIDFSTSLERGKFE